MARSKLANYIHPICVRLWQIRKQKKISLEKLSIKSGYSIHTIVNWENGLTAPSLLDLDNWAQSLQTRIYFNFEGLS